MEYFASGHVDILIVHEQDYPISHLSVLRSLENCSLIDNPRQFKSEDRDGGEY
ncbi:MAG: hypothetical protein OXM57_08870 [bacterium]|nr:hypothetical protein [bacterium]